MFSGSRNSRAPFPILPDVTEKPRGGGVLGADPQGNSLVNIGRIMNWTCATMGRTEGLKVMSLLKLSSEHLPLPQNKIQS